MKTKLISKAMPAVSLASFTGTSIKTICLLLLVLFSLRPSETKAQMVAVVTGTGMGVCAAYSFAVNSTNTITPLNYGSQTFACFGTTKEDIAFSPQGNGWRVMISLWSFIPNTTCTLSTLYGYDAGGTPITGVSLNPNDVLLPCCYVAGTPNTVQFTLNGTTLPGTYNRNNWYIESY